MSEALSRQLLLAIASGLLYPFCFPDYNAAILAWIVLVPLHFAIDGVTPRRAWWLGWLAGVAAFSTTMFWVVTAMHVYGRMPLPFAFVALLLLAAYLGLYVAAYALGFSLIHRAWPGVAFLCAAPLWVGLELLRTYAFSGLPWALLGYSQSSVLSVIQIADTVGVYGISALIVLVNAAVAAVLLWAFKRHRAHWWTYAVPALAVIGLAIDVYYGLVALWPQTAEPKTVSVGLVQPNIDQAHKWDRAFTDETLARYERLTEKVATGSQLIIWPEAATPFLFENEPLYQERIASMARGAGVPILFGSPALRHYQNGRPYLLNSAYLFSADGGILGRYDKRHLVPFGEYIPLKSVLFFLDKLVVGIGDFEAGTVPTVLRAAPTQPAFGVVICFEVIFPDLVREFAREGAEFMVTITNDAWFGESAAPYQHFGMVVLRAVENHVAFARAANTGITGLIDPNGRVLAATPIYIEHAVTGAIPLSRGPTFYSMHGDVFAYGCAIIATLFLLAAIVMKRMR